MRRLLTLACRAFRRDHRARSSDEVVDTALLAADGSALQAAREAVSLVAGGTRQRLRAESGRPLRDGLALLAGMLAVVNLAVALAGTAGVNPPLLPYASSALPPYPYRPDWWWIGFAIAAAGIVLGLVRGDRRLALGAALANLGFILYDAIFPGHVESSLLSLLYYAPTFPAGREWLAPAVVLALATAAAPLRRRPLTRVPLVVAAVVALVALSREAPGHFLFLRWPLALLLVLAIAFGVLVPRLAVLAVGAVLAAAPSGFTFLTGSDFNHHLSVARFVAAGLAVGAFVPFARLVRRRLT
ncbi:MAG TPA: hypothetical protein VGM45_10810 [Gaiellaceae bacterium]